MSDIVGVLGYEGQDVCFLESDYYAYATGKSCFVMDINKGPREMLWRVESGIACIASHVGLQLMAIAPVNVNMGVEIVKFSTQTVLAAISLPCTGQVVDMAFSRSGERLYLLTDSSDHKVIAWNLVSKQIVFVESLKTEFRRIVVNPGDEGVFALFGEEGVNIGIVTEIMGSFSVKLLPLTIEPDLRFDDMEVSEDVKLQAMAISNSITFVVWAPFDYLIIGNRQGNIIEAKYLDAQPSTVLRKSSIKKISIGQGSPGSSFATCAALTNTSLIVCTSAGLVFWLPIYGFGSPPPIDAPMVDCINAMQVFALSGYVCSLSIDPLYRKVLVGSQLGELVKLPVDVQEPAEKEQTQEDNADLETQYTNAQKDTVLVIQGESVCHFQSGAILCCKAMMVPHGTKNHISLFVTGSHLGQISFWQQPFIESERVTENGGIRRSAPRAISLLATIQVGISTGKSSSANPPPVVCALEVLPFKSKPESCLLGVGTEAGWFEVWEVSAQISEEEDEGGEENVTISATRIAMRHFFHTSLSILASSMYTIPIGGTNATKNCIAIGSSFDTCIHIVEIQNSANGCVFDVKNCLKIDEAITPSAFMWYEGAMWVTGSNGLVYKFFPDMLTKVSETGDISFVTPVLSWTSGTSSIISATLIRSAPSRLLTCSLSSPTLKQFFLQDVLDETKVLHKDGHSDAILCCVTSPNGQFVAVGCFDGSVYLWEVSAGETLLLLNRAQLHADSILCLCFSADSSLLLSCGADGSYFICTVTKKINLQLTSQGMPIDQNAISDEEFLNTHAAAALAPDSKTWLEQKRISMLEALKFHNSERLSNVSTSMADISNRLKALLEQNAERTELEQMERAEFVVNTKGRDDLVDMNRLNAESVRLAYFRLNSWNELSAARVRQTCWDAMDTQARCIYPLLDDGRDSGVVPFVTSLSVRKYTDEESITLERVKRLRAIEMLSLVKHGGGVVSKLPGGKSRSCWISAIQGCPENTSWIAFDGARWPCADLVEMLAAKEASESKAGAAVDNKEEEAVAAADEEEGSLDAEADRTVDDNDVFNLLYPPQSVRTQTQKRTQIILLKEVARIARSKFNVHFDKLVRDKEDVMASVESRNARIREILTELQQQEDYLDPKWRDVEIAGSAILVQPEEIVNKPYESEAQRQIRIKEEEERRRREEEKDAEDVKGRALEEMMNGTLEVKRDVFAEASAMHRPDWMDTTAPADMTEAQLREVDAFETKFKAIQEEQAKYRKSLEIELKKLKMEAIEVCKAFDEKLAAMAKTKVLVMREILSQELYVASVAQSMAKRDQAWNMLKKNEELIDSMRAERSEKRAKIDEFSVEVEKIKAKLNAAQEDERNLEKGFKRDIQTLCNATFDQDTLKVFSLLYRKRSYPDGGEDEDEDYEESEVLAGGTASNQISKNGSKAGKGKGSVNKGSKMGASDAKGGKKGQPKASKGASAGAKDSLGPMQEAAKALDGAIDMPALDEKDPFFLALLQKEKMKKAAEAQIPLLIPLDMDRDCPEGFSVDQFTWSKLQELYTQRIEKEVESKQLAIAHAELRKKLDQLCTEESVLVSCINELRSNREETMKYLHELESNLEVVVSLRQGQDEVDMDAVVTDYSDATLLPSEVIGKFNARIKEHGKEKIGVLNRVKHFRRKINIIDWEAKHLALESHHFEEYFSDLQLLRVTRELQQVIREGSDAAQTKVHKRLRLKNDAMPHDTQTKLLITCSHSQH